MSELPPAVHTVPGMRLRIEVNANGETVLRWGLFDAPAGMRWLLAAFPWIFYFAWGFGAWRAGSVLWHELARGFGGEAARWFWGNAFSAFFWLALWLAAGVLAFRLLGILPRLARPSVITLSSTVLRCEPSVESAFSPDAARRGEPMPRLPFRAGRPRALGRDEIRQLEIITVADTPQLAVYSAQENFFIGLGLEAADIRRLERELRRWLGGAGGPSGAGLRQQDRMGPDPPRAHQRLGKGGTFQWGWKTSPSR